MSGASPSEEALALLVGVDDGAIPGLAERVTARGLGLHRVASVEEARAAVHYRSVAVVFIGSISVEELAGFCDVCPEAPVVALQDHADERLFADTLRAGAVAVLDRGATDAQLGVALERALGGREPSSPEEDAAAPAHGHGKLLGASEPMQRVLDLVERTAPSSATVLLRGETGTGKELVARALHEKSPRSSAPFVKVHCAALPESLLESELFGYEKGAFTGAQSRKPGRVELAEGGTLFLDEIGDITLAMQVKLLRLLQDREYERLGGTRSFRADVRFVAATHRDLENMAKKGEFREDLYYRLNVVTLWLPPLRARRDDIPLLLKDFVGEFARTHGKPRLRLDDAAVRALRAERWPGNVRQLQNFVERLVVLSMGDVVTAEDVEREMTARMDFKTQLTTGAVVPPHAVLEAAADRTAQAPGSLSLGEAVRDAERLALERALRSAGGNRTVAARILGISRATVHAKIREHGLA